MMRVSQSPATKMPVHNLAKVFGPTIVGYSSPEPEAMQVGSSEFSFVGSYPSSPPIEYQYALLD